MEAATRNAESPQSLPLFRAEALAARQKIQGDALLIRPFSFAFFLLLIASLSATALGFLLLAHFEPRVSVAASQTRPLAGPGNGVPGQIEAVFHVPEAVASNIRAGLLVPVRCQQCGSTTVYRGTVTSVVPMSDRPQNATSADPGSSSATFRITVAVRLPDSLPGAAPSQQITKIEAEFPFNRRPLIRWLIGSAVWGKF